MTIEDLSATACAHLNIIHGIYHYAMPLLAQTTVAQARRWLEERAIVHPQSVAVLEGKEVSADAVVRPGQYLCICRRAGTMGP